MFLCFILLLQNVLLCLAIASSQLPSVVTFIIPFHRCCCSPTFQIIHDLFCCLTRVIVHPLCAIERVTPAPVARGQGYHFANSEPCLFLGSWLTMFTPAWAAWSLVTNTETEGKIKILLFPELNYYFHGRDDQSSHP